jgi:hippurate hydrolase
MPLSASEDFSFYLKKKPGCFWMFGTKRPGEIQEKVLHTSTYDYNDNLISSGAYFYIRLCEDRLGINLLE